MSIGDLPTNPGNTIRMAIPASIVLGLVKAVLPIDATVIAAHFDEATGNIELVVASDLFRQPAPSEKKG